jgi:hypothetical protein
MAKASSVDLDEELVFAYCWDRFRPQFIRLVVLCSKLVSTGYVVLALLRIILREVVLLSYGAQRCWLKSS